MVKRRDFLSLLPAGAVLCLAPKSAQAHGIKPSVDQLRGYYAYLWTEMNLVEKLLDIDRFDHDALEKGKPLASALRASTSLEQRIAAIDELNQPRAPRALFRPR